jgi:hypothetical protein
MRFLIPLAAAAGVLTLAVPATAEAASAPTAAVALAHSQISSGSKPSITYLTAGLPAGSVTLLQERRAGSRHGWTAVERLGTAGTVSAPALPAGVWQFRLIAGDGGRRVLASASAYLTVEPAPAHSSGGTDWSRLGALVPWLLLLFGS